MEDIEAALVKKYSKVIEDEFKTDLIFESGQSPTPGKQQHTSTDHYRNNETAKIEPTLNAEIDTK